MNQVRFLITLIFRSTNMLAQIADLTSLRPCVPATLCPTPLCLRPYVGFRTVEASHYPFCW